MKQLAAIAPCDDYNYDRVKNAVIYCFERLGGIDRYISKGDRVLLKVNLLMKKSPDAAVTTHPAIVKALCEVLIEYGAIVIIGDSPGGPFDKKSLTAVYKATGMEDIAVETGATLNFNTSSVSRENPCGVVLKKMKVIGILDEVDKVISVSKLKTHAMMTFTGAVKNMFGVIPGLTKAQYHAKMPEYTKFANALIDICLCANPVLSFMDGIYGMEGNGPSGGTPRHIGAVLASDSPFALDKTACRIIGFEFDTVPTLSESIKRKLCAHDLSDITFTGESYEKFAVTDFKLPESMAIIPLNRLIPKPIRRFLEKRTQPKPVFVTEKCVGCGDCAANCPAKVIRMENKKPIVDLSKCIRCFCCQELCPVKAIDFPHTSRHLKTRR